MHSKSSCRTSLKDLRTSWSSLIVNFQRWSLRDYSLLVLEAFVPGKRGSRVGVANVVRLRSVGQPFSVLQEPLKHLFRKGQYLQMLYALERKMISKRTRAGMARAKAMDKHVGRKPKLTEESLRRVKELLSFGVPKKRIAELLDVIRATLYRYLRKI